MSSGVGFNLRARLATGVLSIFLAAITIPADTAGPCAISKPIQYNEHEAPYISKAFDAFLQLIEKRELPKNALSYPTHLSQVGDDTIVIAQSFYVSPTETRGFELMIPKEVLSERELVFFQKEPLVIENESTRQNIKCLVLRKKSFMSGPKTASLGLSEKNKRK
jgi:hypothetical protein